MRIFLLCGRRSLGQIFVCPSQMRHGADADVQRVSLTSSFISFRSTCHLAFAVNATMKISSIAASLLAAASTGTIAGVQAFVSSPASSRCVGRQSNTFLSMSSNGPDDDMLKASAEQMKNLKPEDIDRMMAEMESMGPAQKVCERNHGSRYFEESLHRMLATHVFYKHKISLIIFFFYMTLISTNRME